MEIITVSLIIQLTNEEVVSLALRQEEKMFDIFKTNELPIKSEIPQLAQIIQSVFKANDGLSEYRTSGEKKTNKAGT